MLEVTVSGYYYKNTKMGMEPVDFDKLKIVLPDIEDEDVMRMHLRDRIVPGTIRNKHRVRITDVYEMYIDDVKSVDGTPDFYGKALEDMTELQRQVAAAWLDLRSYPVDPKGTNRRQAEEFAKHYGEHMGITATAKTLFKPNGDLKPSTPNK